MRRIPDLPPPEFIPKDRWYTLVPKRSLGKIVAMLIMLAAVVYFRSRAGNVVGLFGKTIAPARATLRPAAAPPSGIPKPPPTGPASARSAGAGGNSVPSSAP
jgi:hypothetical protein